MKARKRLEALAFTFLVLAGFAAATDVGYGGFIEIGSDVRPAQGDLTVTAGVPVNSASWDNDSFQVFNATLTSPNNVSNATLMVYNSSGHSILSFLNDTELNGSKYLGSHQFNVGSFKWAVYGCDTSSCVWTSNRSFTVFDYLPEVILDYPADTQVFGVNNITFNCTVAANDTVQNTTLLVYNSSGLYTSSTTVGGGDGVKSWSVSGILNNDYNWSCRVFDGDGSVAVASNRSFTVDVFTPSGLDTAGECLTDRGFSYAMTAGVGVNYVLFNLSQLGEYLVNVSLPNVWVEGSDSYWHSDNALVVNTTSNKSITVWLGGYTTNFTHAALSPAISQTVNLSITDFTRQNNAYWLEVRDEDSGAFWDYGDSTSHYLDVYCLEYATDRINLKSLDESRFLLTVKEKPLFWSILDESQDRIFEVRRVNQTVQLFFLNPSLDTCDYSFTLADYTNSFQSSYLLIDTNINSTIKSVWQQQFVSLLVRDVELKAGDYYKIRVEQGDTFRDINWFRAACNDTDKAVTITEPFIGNPLNPYDNIIMGFTGDFDASSVGFTYNYTGSGTIGDAVFTVYLQNDSGSHQVYSSTRTGFNSGAFSSAVNASNNTYLVTASVSTPDYGVLTARGVYALWNNSGMYVDYSQMPESVLGEKTTDWFNLISLFVLMTGACMLGAFYTRYAGLFVAFGGAVLAWMGFMAVPQPIWIFAVIMAALSYVAGGGGAK